MYYVVDCEEDRVNGRYEDYSSALQLRSELEGGARMAGTYNAFRYQIVNWTEQYDVYEELGLHRD